MKQLRPVLALAAMVLCTWSASSNACDQTKKSAMAASTSGAACSDKAATTAYHAKTAGMTAKQAGGACTAEMAAACARGAKAAKNVTASNTPDCCAAKGANTAASMKGSAKHSAAYAELEAHCAPGARNTAMLAGAGGSCAAHGAKTTAMTAGSGAACGPHGAKNTMTAADKNAACGGRGMVWASGQSAHGSGCDACADMNACDQSLRELGAVMQAVALKNGVMFVYTTDPAKARLVQRAMAQRKDQMALFASSSNSAHLCSDCKSMRGAAMSGKLIREVVNIEGGCLSLITSADPAIVAKIHALSGVSAMARAKI